MSLAFGTPLEEALAGDDPVARTLRAIADACARLAHIVARGPLQGSLAETVSERVGSADAQTRLDVVADRLMQEALEHAPVRWLASEERAGVAALVAGAPLAVALDPLDGSSNIAANAPLGTIFSIRAAGEDALSTFLAPGREQLAAGFAIYGPLTALVLTFGAGVDVFVRDPDDGIFRLARSGIRIPEDTREFAINASNRRHWSSGLQSWFDERLAGEAGPAARDFNMRWIASLVAEAYRILERGGIFLYPADARPGYSRGRLRLVYEAAPIALLVERAGGLAVTGDGMRLLDVTGHDIHERIPLIFGSRDAGAEFDLLSFPASDPPAGTGPHLR
ncbi:MAG: class 1 fructose-bisphosphatase [Salinarimonas sp.]